MPSPAEAAGSFFSFRPGGSLPDEGQLAGDLLAKSVLFFFREGRGQAEVGQDVADFVEDAALTGHKAEGL